MCDDCVFWLNVKNKRYGIDMLLCMRDKLAVILQKQRVMCLNSESAGCSLMRWTVYCVCDTVCSLVQCHCEPSQVQMLEVCKEAVHWRCLLIVAASDSYVCASVSFLK